MINFYRLITLIFSGVICTEIYAQISQDGKAKASLYTNLSTPVVTLESLMNPVSQASTGVTDLRIQMLVEAGKTVGFRGGLIDRSRSLTAALKVRTDSLDKIFQFAPLVNKNGTIPPVIVEAQDITSFSSDQIRMANRVYKIEKEERFVSVPPTWQDYLFVGLPVGDTVEMPSLDARPQNNSEQTIWQDAVKLGWHEGRNQADAILSANFNRLARDYTGMMRYSALLQQGMISATKTAETQQTVTGDAKQIILGDTFRRLISKAVFETDAKKWRPTVSKALIVGSLHSPLDSFSARWRVLGLDKFTIPGMDCNNSSDKAMGMNRYCLSKNDSFAHFELPRLWLLTKEKTLKENLAEWAHIAGWKEPVWTTDNPYQIVDTTSMDGTFIEVLERISQSVPDLDIHVWKSQRNIRVSDRKK